MVLNAPATFDTELKQLQGVRIRRSLAGLKRIEFGITFVIKQAELNAAMRAMGKLAEGDAVVWFAYPKKSSKRYASEVNRDDSWTVVGENGFEPVRMVAIDEDWSALRVRRVEFIKKMTRATEHAMTAEGKRKTRRA